MKLKSTTMMENTILLMSNPFKVFNSIIGFIGINMINITKIFRIGYKQFRNQTMNIFSNKFLINKKINMKVSFRIFSGRHKLLSFSGIYRSIGMNNIFTIVDRFFHNYKGTKNNLKYKFI